jgi:chromosome segregation ATPase
MANRILKGLAVAAGTGLAMGISSGRSRVQSRPSPQYTPVPSEVVDDDVLDIEPLLDRIERLEARLESGIASQSSLDRYASQYALALADLERRIDENSREVALLREEISAAERRMTESAAAVRAEIPAIVEQQVSVRIEALENRFTEEIAESQRQSLAIFERSIDEKISSRIGAIEKTLAGQSESIEALREHTAETDRNLQRLVIAIEKLCDRAQLIPGEPSFEAHMDDAMQREPVRPVLRTEEPESEPPAFTGGTAKRSRLSIFSVFVAGLGLLAARFFRA